VNLLYEDLFRARQAELISDARAHRLTRRTETRTSRLRRTR
jgi:hypothetical protein